MSQRKHYFSLTILRDVPDTKPAKVECRCQCGRIKTVTKSHVLSGHTKSCGCLRARVARARRHSEKIALIPLDCGGIAIVDAADLPLVAQYNWVRNLKSNYAFANNGRGTVYLHRLVLGIQDPKMQTDHKNGDRADCTRHNLRASTSLENAGNWHTSHSSTGYRGVSRWKKRWQAKGYHNHQAAHLGYFRSARAAAQAYDRWARQVRGPDAATNFPTRK